MKPKAKRHLTKASGTTPVASEMERRKVELDRLCPIRTCYVCDRTSRDLQRIGPEKHRHDDCNPGSPNWIDYYETLKKKDRTDAMTFLYDHAKAQS